VISYFAPPPIAAAIAAHDSYLRDELLAERLEPITPHNDASRLMLNGHKQELNESQNFVRRESLAILQFFPPLNIKEGNGIYRIWIPAFGRKDHHNTTAAISRPCRHSSCEDPSAWSLHQHHEVIQPEFGTRSTRRSGSPVPPGYAGEFGFQPHLISCPSWSPPIPPSSRPEGQVLRSSRKSGGAAGLLHDLGVDSLRITSSCFLANKTSARCLPRHEPIRLRSRGMRQEWPVNRRVARGNWGTYPPSSGVQPF